MEDVDIASLRDVSAPESGTARAARLFDAYGAALARYLARRVGRDAAEDLVSEVFVVMVGDDRELDPARGGERAWLFGIATNLARRHHRDLVRTDQAMARAAAAVAVAVPTHAGDVDAHVDARRRVDGLLGALRDLRDDDRDVLLLVAWGGLTSAEAGVVVAAPVITSEISGDLQITGSFSRADATLLAAGLAAGDLTLVAS